MLETLSHLGHRRLEGSWGRNAAMSGGVWEGGNWGCDRIEVYSWLSWEHRNLNPGFYDSTKRAVSIRPHEWQTKHAFQSRSSDGSGKKGSGLETGKLIVRILSQVEGNLLAPSHSHSYPLRWVLLFPPFYWWWNWGSRGWVISQRAHSWHMVVQTVWLLSLWSQSLCCLLTTIVASRVEKRQRGLMILDSENCQGLDDWWDGAGEWEEGVKRDS